MVDEQENEQEEEKTTEEIFEAHGEALDKWEKDVPDEATREEIVDHITRTGEIPEGASLSPGQIDAVYDGYMRHIQNEITGPLGLDINTWVENIAESDIPQIYGLVLKGDWGAVRAHASAVKDHIRRNSGS